mmetsp:Transcript_3448/g.8215  ORF Transcript_3448/g.8215 Transcript_3448/m.8215 type:complete len:284 (-) Transcript_3448:442-1293(-)
MAPRRCLDLCVVYTACLCLPVSACLSGPSMSVLSASASVCLSALSVSVCRVLGQGHSGRLGHSHVSVSRFDCYRRSQGQCELPAKKAPRVTRSWEGRAWSSVRSPQSEPTGLLFCAALTTVHFRIAQSLGAEEVKFALLCRLHHPQLCALTLQRRLQVAHLRADDGVRSLALLFDLLGLLLYRVGLLQVSRYFLYHVVHKFVLLACCLLRNRQLFLGLNERLKLIQHKHELFGFGVEFDRRSGCSGPTGDRLFLGTRLLFVGADHLISFRANFLTKSLDRRFS